MLTPKFDLSQDDSFITLIIYAPYTNVAEAQFHTEDQMIIFHSKPYYLRLHLPGRVLDDDRNEAAYDVDKGTYTARIVKETKGEVFEGLDMLTKLLTPPEARWKSELKPNLVEEIGSSDAISEQTEMCGSSCGDGDNSEGTGLDDDIDWFIDQCDSSDTETSDIMSGSKYGFAQRKSGFSQKLMLEFSDIFDVKDPDSLSSSEKKQKRHAHEADHFNDDYYLADLYDNSEIPDILNFKPWWVDMSKGCTLTPEAKEKMLNLPKKSYLLDAEELNGVYLGLVDLIFAYAYNHRVLYGENNVESGWTIAKLASTLSWLGTFTCLRDVVVTCFRRALVFPLYRNWDVCVKVLEDVRTLFAGGKKVLLKCLLDIHSCMIVSDPRFIFNDLYITDYCVWIQSARSKHIQSLATALQILAVSKKDVGLDLEELELAASMVLREQEGDSGVEDITHRVGQIDVGQPTSPLDSDDDSDQDQRKDKKEVTSEEETEESEDDSDDEDEEDSGDEEESEHEYREGKKETEDVRDEDSDAVKVESSGSK
ncbi:protein SHQ1 homolog [Babylonia areolata]|uniref:protein SHQ1 homolog n=1 Tax=Babylonia areolata TaxID=304850 RepID=UPI003FD4F4F3